MKAALHGAAAGEPPGIAAPPPPRAGAQPMMMAGDGDGSSMRQAAAWTPAGERSLAAPPAGDATRAALADLLPPGAGYALLAPAIAEEILAAAFYAYARRCVGAIRLQFFLRQDAAAPACGWSFFLVEGGAHSPAEAVVQIFLFHE